MRYQSFVVIIIVIMLPPLLYLFSIEWLETHFEDKYSTDIQDVYTVDSKQLFDGSITVKESINNNIQKYLEGQPFLLNDIQVNITVVTRQGVILYPMLSEGLNNDFLHQDSLQVAADNYRILNDGLIINVSVVLGRNTKLSYLVFVLFLTLSLGVLFSYYKVTLKKERTEALRVSREIDRLSKKEKETNQQLDMLTKARRELEVELRKMKQRVSEATKSEDGMIDEIVTLEDKLTQNLDLQKTQQEEIDELKARIEQFRIGKKKGGRQKLRGHDAVAKRFRALYKNISVHDRAIDGYLDLEEDMKLKCEEIVHQLNESPDLVTVKRKVFGRKGRETVLEVIYGYKGRLYYRISKDGSPEVLAVGTKNTQARELDFLNRL